MSVTLHCVILIISRILPQRFDLEGFLLDQWPRYIVYLYSFALVADVWYIHSGWVISSNSIGSQATLCLELVLRNDGFWILYDLNTFPPTVYSVLLRM